jgi:hypothetical protein
MQPKEMIYEKENNKKASSWLFYRLELAQSIKEQ